MVVVVVGWGCLWLWLWLWPCVCVCVCARARARVSVGKRTDRALRVVELRVLQRQQPLTAGVRAFARVRADVCARACVRANARVPHVNTRARLGEGAALRHFGSLAANWARLGVSARSCARARAVVRVHLLQAPSQEEIEEDREKCVFLS